MCLLTSRIQEAGPILGSQPFLPPEIFTDIFAQRLVCAAHSLLPMQPQKKKGKTGHVSNPSFSLSGINWLSSPWHHQIMMGSAELRSLSTPAVYEVSNHPDAMATKWKEHMTHIFPGKQMLDPGPLITFWRFAAFPKSKHSSDHNQPSKVPHFLIRAINTTPLLAALVNEHPKHFQRYGLKVEKKSGLVDERPGSGWLRPVAPIDLCSLPREAPTLDTFDVNTFILVVRIQVAMHHTSQFKG